MLRYSKQQSNIRLGKDRIQVTHVVHPSATLVEVRLIAKPVYPLAHIQV